MKLAIGTVQFGLDYGISNQQGRVSETEINAILATAHKDNITTFDTASSYGKSEYLLGKYMQATANYLGKIAPTTAPKDIENEAITSLKNLRANHFSCLSAHHAKWLLNSEHGDDNYQALLNLKNKGLTKRIGCSVYNIEEAKTLINRYDIDVVQLPANLCDQQVFDSSFLSLCDSQNIEIHIRSLFLQGALLMQPSQLPEHLAPLKATHDTLTQIASGNNINKMTLLLAPFVQHPQISKIIIGCCSNNQLIEVINAYQQANVEQFNYQDFAIFDDNITNPSLWPA